MIFSVVYLLGLVITMFLTANRFLDKNLGNTEFFYILLAGICWPIVVVGYILIGLVNGMR